MVWKQHTGFAVALWGYTANGNFQVSFERGDEIQIQESTTDWYKGYLLKDKAQKGIFPANFFRVEDDAGQIDVDDLKPPDVTPLLKEIRDTLQEWVTEWKQIYSRRDVTKFEDVEKRMVEMRDLRRELVAPFLEEKTYESLRERLHSRIDEGREYLGLDKVVRKDDGTLVDAKNTPITELYRVHRNINKEYKIGGTIPVKPAKAKAVAVGEQNSQIVMDLKSVICAVDGDMELFFRLYSRKDKKFVTEEFTAGYSATGLPHDLDSLNEMKTVFRDISPRDISTSQLWLVCRLIRKGKLQAKTKNQLAYRRPFGCACLELTPEMLKPEKELPSSWASLREHRMIIYTSSNESNFSQLHDLIVQRSPNIEQVPRSIGIDITLFTMESDFQPVVEMFPGVAATQKLSFGEVILPGEARNDLYLVIQGGDFLQGRKTSAMNVEARLEVRLDDGKIIPDCITLGVGNAKPREEYCTYVYYHTNSPKWEELVCLKVPEDLYEKAHCYITFRHCSTSESKAKEEKPFAFAFLPLVEPDETVLKDGNHSIPTYKFPSKNPDDVAWYLRPQEKQLVGRGKESLNLCSSFVSTKLTQNLSLLALLRWKTYPSDLANILNKFTYIEQLEIMKFLREIFDALFQILAEKTEEMAMLVYNAIVFIIGILVDDKTTKFTNFKPILDVYIREHFSSEAAHKMLLMCLKQTLELENQENPRFAAQIRSSMKALEFLFKFMIASRVLFKHRHPQTQDTLFKRDLKELLGLVNALMSRTSPEYVIGAQAIALRSVSMFDELAKIFERRDLAGITCQFLDSVQTTTKRHINIEKLSLMQSLVNGQLFAHEESRRILFPTIRTHLDRHLKNTNEERKSCTLIMTDILYVLETKTSSPHAAMFEVVGMLETILGQIGRAMETYEKEKLVLEKIEILQQGSVDPSMKGGDKGKKKPASQLPECSVSPSDEEEDEKLEQQAGTDESQHLQHVLGRMNCVAQLNKENEDMEMIIESEKELLSIFLQIFYYMPSKLFTMYLDKRPDPKQYASTMMDILGFILSNHDLYFPDNWRVIVCFNFAALLKLIDSFTNILISRFVSGENFDEIIVEKFFHLCKMFITDPHLKLTKLSAQRSSFLTHRYGDMRDVMSRAILKLWRSLGDLQDVYRPRAMKIWLEFMKVDSPIAQNSGLDLFFSMLNREFAETGSFDTMEKETIDTLNVISQAGGDLQLLTEIRENYADCMNFTQWKEFFVKSIESRFEDAGNAKMKAAGDKFLEDVSKVVGLMLALSDYPDTPEYEDERTASILELLEYLKETKRMATYIKFVHQLHDVHLHSKNFTEAAIALKLHHELLNWTDESVPAELQHERYPAKSQKELKEKLFLTAIDRFDQGKTWEMGLLLSAQMRNLYQNRWFNFSSLSDLLAKESKYYAEIINTERFYAEYFRVSFYGTKFDITHRNKHFIVRGYELERIIEFIGRIKNRWPLAEILQSNAPPSDEIVGGEKQYIQVVNVHPCSIEEMNGITPPVNKTIPPRIQKFYENNEVGCFTFSRPIKKSKKKSDNEFKDLWLAKTYFMTKDVFPTTHRRSEIVESKVIEVNPLENAVAGMKQKNGDLEDFVNQFKNPATRPTNISPFTMALNGVIDAAVNGGVFKYQDAFFTDEYKEENADHGDMIQELKDLLNQQLNIVETGLTVHADIVPAAMRGLHEKMETFFKKMRWELTGEGEPPEGTNDAKKDESGTTPTSDTPEASAPESEASEQATAATSTVNPVEESDPAPATGADEAVETFSPPVSATESIPPANLVSDDFVSVSSSSSTSSTPPMKPSVPPPSSPLANSSSGTNTASTRPAGRPPVIFNAGSSGPGSGSPPVRPAGLPPASVGLGMVRQASGIMTIPGHHPMGGRLPPQRPAGPKPGIPSAQISE